MKPATTAAAKASSSHRRRSNNNSNKQQQSGNDNIMESNSSNPSASSSSDNKPPTTSSAAASGEEEKKGLQCVVCCETMNFVGLGACGHCSVCDLCFLRLRVLMKDLKCTLCKSILPAVFVTRVPKAASITSLEDGWASQTYARLNVEYEKEKGNEAGGSIQDFVDFKIDEDSSMVFDRTAWSRYSELVKLRELRCGVSHCPLPHGSKFNDFDSLQNHLKTAHERSLCSLCYENRGQFVMELRRFNDRELSYHMDKGDKNTAFKGHPRCKFCDNMPFYNDDALYKHLNEKHETCFICSRGGFRGDYFRDYASLVQHFQRNHYYCIQPRCVQSRFVAFGTELEYQNHMVKEHPELGISRTINPSLLYGNNTASSFARHRSHREQEAQAQQEQQRQQQEQAQLQLEQQNAANIAELLSDNTAFPGLVSNPAPRASATRPKSFITVSQAAAKTRKAKATTYTEDFPSLPAPVPSAPKTSFTSRPTQTGSNTFRVPVSQSSQPMMAPLQGSSSATSSSSSDNSFSYSSISKQAESSIAAPRSSLVQQDSVPEISEFPSLPKKPTKSLLKQDEERRKKAIEEAKKESLARSKASLEASNLEEDAGFSAVADEFPNLQIYKKESTQSAASSSSSSAKSKPKKISLVPQSNKPAAPLKSAWKS